MSLLVLALLMPRSAQASPEWPITGEWQIKPFLGATFGGGTTYIDSAHAAGDPKRVIGVSVLLLGEIVGIEADFGHTSGFFSDKVMLLGVVDSGVTTFCGNIVLALPRHVAQYTLRPYLVGGAGLMHAFIQDSTKVPFTPTNVTEGADNMLAIDIGGGVTGFLTDRIGVNWDVRWFNSVGGTASGPLRTISGLPKQLSLWRASMAMTIRLRRSTR